MTILHKIRRINEENGFTLIEILASITILIVIVLAFSNVLSSGVRVSYANQQENVALSLAQERIEQIKAAWPSSDAQLDRTDFKDLNDTVVRDGITYTRTFSHSTAAFTPANWTKDPTTTGQTAAFTKNLLKATVKVSWVNKTLNGDVPKSITFITYLTGR